MKYTALIICFFLSSHAVKHDFHVSITRVKLNSESKKLECSIKVFTDDLEKTLESLCTDRLHLNCHKESSKTNYYLVSYLRKHFSISVNNKVVSFHVIGKEYEDDVTWIYLETDKIKSPQSIAVKNSLLFNTFNDQVNIVHVTKSKIEKKSLFLKSGTPKDVVHF